MSMSARCNDGWQDASPTGGDVSSGRVKNKNTCHVCQVLLDQVNTEDTNFAWAVSAYLPLTANVIFI